MFWVMKWTLEGGADDSIVRVGCVGPVLVLGGPPAVHGGAGRVDRVQIPLSSRQSDSCQSSGPKASEERLTSPTRTRIRIRLSAASPLSDVRQTQPDGRRSLDVPPRDVTEAQRERWRRFREGRSSASRPKKARVTPVEPSEFETVWPRPSGFE